jgi:hypothetical protein
LLFYPLQPVYPILFIEFSLLKIPTLIFIFLAES